MQEKPNNKISVLRKMVGLNKTNDAQPIVPQNSATNLRYKMGLTEQNAFQRNPSAPTIYPIEGQRSTVKCPHCENMAKNFLYLESLIRSNYNSKYQCSLCYSSLKYLQYVNKSIMQVFGNLDTIVQAAHTFALPQKRIIRLTKSASRQKLGRGKSKLRLGSHSALSNDKKGSGTKHSLPKNKSRLRGGDTDDSKNQTTRKRSKSQSKISIKKSNSKNKTTSKNNLSDGKRVKSKKSNKNLKSKSKTGGKKTPAEIPEMDTK